MRKAQFLVIVDPVHAGNRPVEVGKTSRSNAATTDSHMGITHTGEIVDKEIDSIVGLQCEVGASAFDPTGFSVVDGLGVGGDPLADAA